MSTLHYMFNVSKYSLLSCIFGLNESSSKKSNLEPISNNENKNEIIDEIQANNIIELVKLEEIETKSEVSVNAILIDYFSNLTNPEPNIDPDDIEITRNQKMWNANYKQLKLSNFFGY